MFSHVLIQKFFHLTAEAGNYENKKDIQDRITNSIAALRRNCSERDILTLQVLWKADFSAAAQDYSVNSRNLLQNAFYLNNQVKEIARIGGRFGAALTNGMGRHAIKAVTYADNMTLISNQTDSMSLIRNIVSGNQDADNTNAALLLGELSHIEKLYNQNLKAYHENTKR